MMTMLMMMMMMMMQFAVFDAIAVKNKQLGKPASILSSCQVL